MFARKELAKQRYKICKSCEEFRTITKTCKICNCFMFFKTKLINSGCPLDKWKNPTNTWMTK